ncbi:MAG TPA: UrcA family protein [Rhizomicrobium sp.]|nr:UrcA family protein [Rhizomicrobium sp.]
MTKTLRGFCGMLLVLNLGTIGAGSASVLAAAESDEKVTVTSPYTIRQQVLTRSLSRQMQIGRISVEQDVSYADLNLSKEADVAVMRQRLKEAAVQGCNELDRRFPRSIYVPVQDTDCVKDATARALARLDGILGK